MFEQEEDEFHPIDLQQQAKIVDQLFKEFEIEGT
jgi:hypothetical protein